MKVLVAEDSTMMQRLLLRTLEKWRYDVSVARDGAEAWELFQRDHYPLVLTDWMMPELDGVELTRRIRATKQPGYVYIILLTAKTEKQDLVAAMDAGADDFLSKPFDQEELRVRVREGERIVLLERALADQNRQLREAQAALVQSEKLASLGQLAAGMAHEINNPIAYVANNLAVLRRDVLAEMQLLEKYRQQRDTLTAIDPAWGAEVAAIEETCDLEWLEENLPRLFQTSLEGLGRVRGIVNNLRDFARLDEAELDELDINAAWQSTAKVLHHELAEKHLKVVTQFEPGIRIVCRPQKINQLLYNLLLNALQASEAGDQIWIRTRVSDEHVIMEVEDEGCGIEPGHLTRVFEPFFTTKPIGRGTGLGLAISYGIVRDHGGAIEVESQLGKGSLFRIRLPLHPPQISASKKARRKVPAKIKCETAERPDVDGTLTRSES